MINCPVGAVVYTANTQPDTAAEIVWPVETSGCDDEEALALRPDLIAAAVDALHEATCRRFGVCTLAVRPCVTNCACHQVVCAQQCDFRRFDLGDITAHPIISIDEVRVNGAVVPSTDYWLSNGRWLVPLRDGGLWDCPTQDLNAAAGSAGTWSVTLTIGVAPKPMVLLAAADLACQLLKYFQNKPCDVPTNAVSVTRDGVTVRLDTGLKAIPTVKMALELYGDCAKRKQRSRIVHPADFITHTTNSGA